MYKVRGYLQSYDWGKKYQDSIISKFLGLDKDIYKNELICSELWYGTHLNGESYLGELDCKLKDYYEQELPFLFKILSIDKCLSIQVHPDLDHAKLLHEINPKIYKDPNPKPEMVLALSEMEILMGFKHKNDLNFIVNLYPMFGECIGFDEISTIKDLFQNLFRNNLDFGNETNNNSNQNNNLIQETISSMIYQIDFKMKNSLVIYDFEKLFLKLFQQYKYDIGLLASLFLNYIILKPLECIYIEPNTIHAYISGECLECMANSDNVVRAGLTNKYKDLDTLFKITNFKSQNVYKIEPNNLLNSKCKIYKPESLLFQFIYIQIENESINLSNYFIDSNQNAQFILVLNGCGIIKNQNSYKFISQGDCIFQDSRQNQNLSIANLSNIALQIVICTN